MEKRCSTGFSKILIICFCTAVVLTLVMGISPSLLAANKASVGTVIDINTADQKTLESLPGVGPATAKAIIAGRPYKSVDELKKVKGMSNAKISAIKNMVTAGGATASSTTSAASQKVASAEKTVAGASATASQTAASAEKSATEKTSKATKKLAPGQRVNINTATKEELQAIPGIGASKAQSIIAARPFDKPEDIMKVKGIKQKTYDKLKDYITVK